MPIGYQTSILNKPNIQSLALPGIQRAQSGPGGQYNTSPIPGGGLPGSMPGTYAGTSGTMGTTQPSGNMSPYLQSSNLSTLLRVLSGNPRRSLTPG